MPQVNLRLPDDLLAEVDRHRGDIPRNRWFVQAIRRHAAGGEWPPQQRQPGPDVTNIRSSSQSKAGIKPYEKPGKRK